MASHSNDRKPGTLVADYPDIPLIGAIMNSDTEEAKGLIARGVGLNERAPEDQSTPLISAAQTDQWSIVELLCDRGADVWAHDQFGDTVGTYILNSHVLGGSSEDQARLRVIEKLKGQGFPLPPPARNEVLSLDRVGKWPPSKVNR